MSTIVHDQAANMELCLRILHDEKGWESICCNAHCLQLCLKVALSRVAIERLIGAASKLIQHCATRWNSTFHMLERLIEMRWPVSAVLSDEQVTKRSDRYLDLKSEQWVLAKN